MEIYEYDAVVVGSGCAGFNCADWLYDNGVTNIAIVTEGKNLGTSRNTGSDKQTYYKLSLAGDEGDSVYDMAKTLFDGGSMDGDVALAEAANSTRCFMKLASLGMKFPTNKYGEYVGYQTDHDLRCRATSIGPYTSKKMTEVLEASVLSKKIKIHDGVRAIRIIKNEQGVLGLIAVTLKNGALVAFKTPHIVLATGGPASVYFDRVYPEEQRGFSSIALDAGARFSNMSEWQYGLASVGFRWNVSGTYMQTLPRIFSRDEQGQEYEFLSELGNKAALERTFLKGYEWPFDVRKIDGSSRVDLLVYRETKVFGRRVFLDYTKEPIGLQKGFNGLSSRAYDYLRKSGALVPTPFERLKRMNPVAVELYREHGIDLEKEPLEIAVCAQHNNGGIAIDSDYQTNVDGLYAIGEAAGAFGVFRPGGSALNSCQVGAMRAARHIAFFSERGAEVGFREALEEAEGKILSLIELTHGTTSTLKKNRVMYQKTMSEHFSFLRNVNRMTLAEKQIAIWGNTFVAENRWSKKSEIAELFGNLDIIKMQRVIARSMLYAAKNYGSRGSAFVYEGGDFMHAQPVPEVEAGRGSIVSVKKMGKGKLIVKDRPVRPIPARDLWFEKVWKDFRSTEE